MLSRNCVLQRFRVVCTCHQFPPSVLKSTNRSGKPVCSNNVIQRLFISVGMYFFIPTHVMKCNYLLETFSNAKCSASVKFYSLCFASTSGYYWTRPSSTATNNPWDQKRDVKCVA